MEPAAENRARPTELKPDHLYYGIVALVLISPLVFFPSLINLYRLPKTAFISLLVTALIWLWFFLLIQEKDQKPVFPLAVPILLYLGISVLSLVNAMNPYEGIFALSQEAVYIFLFWVVVNHVRTREKIENVLLWAIPSAFIVSLIGIYQMFGGDIPGLANSIAPPGTTFGNKNTAAQYILLTLPLPYVFFFTTADRSKERLFAICAAVTTTYFLYTGTRAAWAGAILASLAIAIFIQLKKPLAEPQIANIKTRISDKKIGLGGVALFVVAMNVIPPYVVPDWNLSGFPSPAGRFGTALELDKDSSFLNRLAMAANTLKMFKDHPVLGVGKGNFKIMYPFYAASVIKDREFKPELQPREAHNDYVQLLAETGTLGFLSFLLIVSVIARRVWISIAGKNEIHSMLLIVTLAFSIIAILVEASLDFPFELPVSLAFLWLFTGLLWVICKENSPHMTDPVSEKKRRMSSARRGTFAVGLLFACAILFTAVHFNFLRAEFYFSRGTIWFYENREGPSQLAENDLKTAVYLNPTTHRYPYMLGLFYIWRENYDEAVKATLQSLRRHPYYINAYNNLGVAFASIGKVREAEWAWKKALDIWPDHSEARNNLATVYAVQGKRREAIALFKESLIRNPKDKDAGQKLKTLLGQAGKLQTP